MAVIQFTDSSETHILAIFGCAQDPISYPNQAKIDESDPRYVAFLNPSKLPAQALAALDKSDSTVLRCYSAGAGLPAVWQTYRSALRAIFNGTDKTSTTLPPTPAYPVGT